MLDRAQVARRWFAEEYEPVVALLRENPDPSEEDIGRALDNNLCRCGAYPRIVAAIRAAAAMKTFQQGAQ